jgi:hypothetical protein
MECREADVKPNVSHAPPASSRGLHLDFTPR